MLSKLLIFSYLTFFYQLNSPPVACDTKFTHRVSAAGTNTFDLWLKPNQSLSGHFSLVDLNQGTIVAEKDVVFGSSDEQPVFRGLSASRYTVYVKQSGCQQARTVGGPEGIKVGIEE